MGSTTYRSLLPDMWRTFISCFFSGPFRTRNLGMPIRSEIKLCFVVGMCWKDFHINFQCMSTLPSWVQSACSVIVQGGRVVKVLDFTTQYHQYQRRNIESSQERNPVVAVVVIQGGRLVMVLDFNSINTVSTLRSSADAVRVRRPYGTSERDSSCTTTPRVERLNAHLVAPIWRI